MKKLFAMLTVCALMLSLCGLPSVGAAENVPDDTSVFFTDFEGYRMGSGAWTKNAFSEKNESGNQAFGAEGFTINVNGDFSNAMVSKTADENHGNSLYIGANGYSDIGFWYWYNGGFEIGKKYLISYDLQMGAVGENYFNILATDGTNIGVLFKNKGVSERNEVLPLKENAFEINEWTRVELYIDTENKKYSVYVGGKLIGEEQSFEFNDPANPEVGAVHFRSVIDNENGIYIDNVGISAPPAPPYAIDAMLPTGVAVGKTLDVTFSSGVNQDTLTTENIKITDSKGAPIAFTIAEKTANGVKLSFAEPLTAGECYSVDMSGVKGSLGQDVVCGNNKTEAYAGNNNLMFTNFNGYALGNGAWTENAFSNKDDKGNQQFRTDAGFGINVNGPYSNAMVQKTADKNHGNSLYIGAKDYSDIGFWYWYNGGCAVGSGKKYLISYDLQMGAAGENYFNILATDGTNIGVLFKNKGVSERNEVLPLKENAFEINEWTRVELYIDTENKKYSVYVGGKLIGEEQSFEFINPANPEVGAVHFRSFIDNENGIYIDNVGIASLDKMPIAKNEITLTAGENNAVKADYKAAAEKTCVFIAAYDNNGILLNAAYNTNQSVDGKGYEGTLSMNKVDGAKTYRAFLWGDNMLPLCPASNPLTVQ